LEVVEQDATVEERRKGKHQERRKLGQGFLVFWVEVEIIVVVTVVAITIMETTMVITTGKIMATTMDKILVITMVTTMGTTTAKTMATTMAKTMAKTMGITMAKTMDTTMDIITSNQVVCVGMTCSFRINMATLMGHAGGLMRLAGPGAILLDGTVAAGTCPGQKNIQTILGHIRHVEILANRTKTLLFQKNIL